MILKKLKKTKFYQEDNIVSFLKSHKNIKNSIYNNRLGLFRRIIKVMTNNPNWDYCVINIKDILFNQEIIDIKGKEKLEL